MSNSDDFDFWEEKVLEMIESGEYEWSEDFLQDVLGSMQYSGTITDKQKQAVENIECGGR